MPNAKGILIFGPKLTIYLSICLYDAYDVKDIPIFFKDVPNFVKNIPNFVNDVPRVPKSVPRWGTISNHFPRVSKGRNGPWEGR